MRIIAKNHDYYDSVLLYGQDENVVYRRFEESFRGDYKNPAPDGYDFMRTGVRNRTAATKKGAEFELESFTVAFCGKLYPGIRVIKNPIELKPVVNCFYDHETYIKFLKENGIKFKTRKKNWMAKYYIQDFADLSYEKTSEEYFQRTGDDKNFQIFVEKRIPVAVWHRDTDEDWKTSNYVLVTNCELKRFNFQKVFSPWQAFQEISMFVGGCMVGDEAAMARVDDEHMMKKKGFDHPYSFRKEPTKKR